MSDPTMERPTEPGTDLGAQRPTEHARAAASAAAERPATAAAGGGDAGYDRPPGSQGSWEQLPSSSGDAGWAAERPATVPVVRTRSASRLPWALAVAALAVVVVGAAAFAFLSSRTNALPGSAAYVPADAALYFDVRLDMPGDQRQKVGELLSRFPGLNLLDAETRLGDALDELVRKSSGGRFSYTSDIKPWSNGQLSVAYLSTPTTGPATASPGAITSAPAVPTFPARVPTFPPFAGAPPDSDILSPPDPAIVASLGVTDPTAARAALDRFRAEAEGRGTAFASEEYAGTTIWRTTTPERSTAGAYAVTADAVLLAGRVEDVKVALDTKAGSRPSLGSSAQIGESLGRLRADRLATVVVNFDAVIRSTPGLPTPGASGDAAAAACTELMRGGFAAALYADSDRLVVEERIRVSDQIPPPPVHESTLARRVPGTTAAYLEVRELGQNMAQTSKLLRENPCFAQLQGQIQIVEAALGADLASFGEWLGDVAFSLTSIGDEPAGGIVAVVRNEETARQRLDAMVDQLSRLSGAEVRRSTQDHNGTTITTLTVEPRAEGGPSGGVSDVPPISYAIRDGILIVSIEDDTFVRQVIDQPQEQSLGAQERFQSSLGGATSNSGLVYVDLSTLASSPVFESAQGPATLFVQRLDRFVAVSTREGAENVVRLSLIVK